MKTKSTFVQVFLSLRMLMICVVALLVLAAMVIYGGGSFERWRGKRDWEKYRAQLLAKGEHLDWDYFVPPQVPNDKNFALTPLVYPLIDLIQDPKTGKFMPRNPGAPLLKIKCDVPGSTQARPDSKKNWSTGDFYSLQAWQAYYRKSLPGMNLSKSPAEDMLTVFSAYDVSLAGLRDALRTHPLCRYPLHYEMSFYMPEDGVFAFGDIIIVLQLRACAELALNRPDDAFADVQLGFQLIATLRHVPTMVGSMARFTYTLSLIQPVWEGVAAHRWRAEQLAALEKDLQAWDFLADFNRAMRTERAAANWLLDHALADRHWFADDNNTTAGGCVRSFTSWGPAYEAVIYRNQVLANTLYQEKFLTIVDEKARTVNVARVKEADEAYRTIPRTPYALLVSFLMPPAVLATTLGRTQTDVNEASVACEIERYRLAHGTLPATLEALQVQNLPHDIINGQPLHYRVTAPDNYLLYSVGCNETDDGGKVAFKTNGAIDFENGDWVWTLKPL